MLRAGPESGQRGGVLTCGIPLVHVDDVLVPLLTPARGEQLGVLQPLDTPGAEDHRGHHERAGAGPATGLVHTGHRTEPGMPEGTLKAVQPGVTARGVSERTPHAPQRTSTRGACAPV